MGALNLNYKSEYGFHVKKEQKHKVIQNQVEQGTTVLNEHNERHNVATWCYFNEGKLMTSRTQYKG